MKYVVYFIILGIIIAGSYFSGYSSGKAQSRIEYITKEVEVVRYVDKKKSEIYSAPNVGRSELLVRLRRGEL